MVHDRLILALLYSEVKLQQLHPVEELVPDTQPRAREHPSRGRHCHFLRDCPLLSDA